MNNEKFIIEVNERTKEKKVIDILDYKFSDNLTMRDIVNGYLTLNDKVEKLNILCTKLVNFIEKNTKATNVQLADIKEEIK